MLKPLDTRFTFQRQVFLMHTGFAGLALFFLIFDFGIPLGWRILGLTATYHVQFIAVLRQPTGNPAFRMWRFLLPLSILMIVPDWVLVTGLETLVFPDTGAPFIGPIPLFMAGLWVIPLFVILWLGALAEQVWGKAAGLGVVALTSAAVFWSSEALLWRLPIWVAQNVPMWRGAARYVLLPEVLLGLTTWWAYQRFGQRTGLVRLAAALCVMLLYLGSLLIGYYMGV